MGEVILDHFIVGVMPQWDQINNNNYHLHGIFKKNRKDKLTPLYIQSSH